MSLSRCSLTSEQVRKYYMSGGPEAHESTGIIFVETQVRGGKVLLGKGAGVGTCRGLVMHVCLEGLGHIGLPNLSRTFLWNHKSSLGMPTAQGRGPGTYLAPFTCLPTDHLVQRALRLRNFGNISPRDLRAGCLVLTVSLQSVWRLQETEMWAELCPSAKGAIFLYNRVQGSPT